MITLSPALRDVLLDGYDTAFPAGSTLVLKDSAGSEMARFILPADTWLPSAAGSKKLREPLKAYALGIGRVASYELANGSFTETGTVTAPDGAGDMTLSETDVIPGTLITVHSFTKVA